MRDRLPQCFHEATRRFSHPQVAVVRSASQTPSGFSFYVVSCDRDCVAVVVANLDVNGPSARADIRVLPLYVVSVETLPISSIKALASLLKVSDVFGAISAALCLHGEFSNSLQHVRDVVAGVFDNF